MAQFLAKSLPKAYLIVFNKRGQVFDDIGMIQLLCVHMCVEEGEGRGEGESGQGSGLV